MSLGRVQFIRELKSLQQAFKALQPELEVCARDPELGVEGYLVVWNTGIAENGPLGPCAKGGTRIHPEVSLDEIKMLAQKMALKNAAAGLPLGGAKSGLRADVDAPHFETQYRRFVSLLKPLLHEHGGIFGGFGFDVGGRPEHPIWVCDELGSTRSFTGKPVEMGGTDYDREGIAGLGVAVAARELLQQKGSNAKKTGFSVQGIGAMGAAVIRYFSEYGGTLQYLSDPRIGGSFALTKPPSQTLLSAITEHNFPATKELLFAEGTLLSKDCSTVLYQETDLLFPCAMQDVLSEKNMRKLKARAIVEGANNPSSSEAQKYYFRTGIEYVPCFLANPGGVIAAFVELTSEITPEENRKTHRNVRIAKALTERKITENITRMCSLSREYHIDSATAASYLAYKNIFEGCQTPDLNDLLLPKTAQSTPLLDSNSLQAV